MSEGEALREATAMGEVARWRERPRRVLDSSARMLLTLARVMLRSRLRPRMEWPSWSVMVVGSGSFA